MSGGPPDSWERMQALFKGALAHPADERTAYLEAHCADDDAIRRDVEALLAAHDAADDVLTPPQLPPSVVAGVAGAVAPAGTRIGERIGRYTIRRLIAQGGMGAVYEADQDSPQRTVALKVVRSGLATPSMLRRFHLEAEVLGRLQHPGIAQIFEADTIREGADERPYLAMELIDGLPLLAYARENALSTRKRLELLARICDAVHHAHQKGVIHRDLKPANILIDASGQPKILDFGVARLTGPDVQLTTARTDMGQLVGTVAYMSPEQVSGDPGGVDTRSDVYTLGVLGYELLAGRRPHDTTTATMPAAVRMIRDDEPVPLGSVVRALRGDLETITSTALEKDRSRRYQSAAELASDIRRHLEYEPIVARPPSVVYQIRKFSKRNRALVGGVTVAIAALIVGIAMTSVQMVRAQRAETAARREADVALAVASFFESTLGSADPFQDKGRDYTVREALEEAADRIDRDGFDDRTIEAAVRRVIGRTYRSLGAFEAAQQHLERALELRLAGADHDALEVAASQRDLGIVRHELGDADGAEPLLRAALVARRAELDEADPLVAESLRDLGSFLKDEAQYEEAREHLEEALEIGRAGGAGPPLVATVLNELGHLALLAGDATRSEELIRESLEIARSHYGETHPAIAETMSNLGFLLRRRGDLEGAEPLVRGALAIREEHLDPDHPDIAASLSGLSDLLYEQSRYADALPLLERMLEIDRLRFPEGHRFIGYDLGHLARTLEELERFDDAEAKYDEALGILEEAQGVDHPETLAAMNNLAVFLKRRRRYEEAQTLYLEVIARSTRAVGAEHRATLLARNNLARLLHEQGKLEDAEHEYRHVLDAQRRAIGDEERTTLVTASNLALLLEDVGRLEEAEEINRRVLDARRRVLGDEHRRTMVTRNVLGALLIRRGAFGEAETLLEEALRWRHRELGAGHDETLSTTMHLARLRLEEGRWAEAETLGRRAATGFAARHGDGDPSTLAARNLLARILIASGGPDRAELLVATLIERAGDAARSESDLSPFHVTRGRWLLAVGRYVGAEEELAEALRLAERGSVRRHRMTVDALDALVELYDAWGRDDEASAIRARRSDVVAAASAPRGELPASP